MIFSRPENWLYLGENCHEVLHLAVPSCVGCSVDIFLSGLRYSLKLYTAFYLLSDVLRRRHPKAVLLRTVPYILRSSLFLTTHGAVFVACICLLRKLLGRFYHYSTALIPAVIGGVAILIERKSRRGVLAGYAGTLAVEVLYNMLKFRGYISPLPYGDVLLFSFGSSVLLHSYHSEPGLRDIVGSFLRVLFKPWVPAGLTMLTDMLYSRPSLSSMLIITFIRIAWVALWSFVVGYLTQAAFSVFKARSKALKQPNKLLHALLNSDNAKLGAFLATLAGGFKVLNTLFMFLPIPYDSRLLLAGLISGLSMLWFRSSVISVYIAGKALEELYFKAVGEGWLPKFYYGDAVLYALACGILFHTVFLEGHNIRFPYWNFINHLVNGRLEQMNYNILDRFGTHASKRVREIRDERQRKKEKQHS